MALTPYCGNCHQFMREVNYTATNYACGCPEPDTTKDPNCHNSGHDHHDPESPIVLGNRAIRDAEEKAEEEARRKRHEFSFNTLDELDEILEDANEQVECLCEDGWVGDCPAHPMMEFSTIPSEPEHACGGCNLKDAVINEYKRLLTRLLIEAPRTDTSQECARWLRMVTSENKIRAMEGD